MNYIYGPVKSRRLGESLGLSVIPYKYCLFNCVYCQLKKTTKFTLDRKEYVRADIVLSELTQFLRDCPDYKRIDYITISGSGEPLLNSRIKKIITQIKKITTIPVAIITNSALLSNDKVRRDISDLDLILPSLDAITQDVFEKIDRPNNLSIKIEDIINGLIELRREFKGNIWLEIMLIKGINDDLEYIRKFKEVIQKINPDKVQLNIPSRPAFESWVRIPTLQRVKKIQSILGKDCELI